MQLKDKVAIITGASKGIGEGIARVFAQEGANLVLVARSRTTEELCHELEREYGIKAIFVSCDVTDVVQCKRVVEAAIETFGKVDTLVNNAGVCHLSSFLETTLEDRDFHFDVNIKGAWNMAQAVIPCMVNQKSGTIVIMSSVTGYMVADAGEVAYATSKAALIGMTKALAREFAQDGVRVNAICPGYVDTPMADQIAYQSNQNDPESIKEGIAMATPLARLATPEEVGRLACFLASDQSSYITGTQVVIDGGSTLPETVSVGA